MVMDKYQATRPQSLTWTEFLKEWQWKQGEHITLVGPTGVGKTTLANAILPRRKYQIVFANKARDASLVKFAIDNDYTIAREWPTRLTNSKIILWPDISNPAAIPAQRESFRRALLDVYTMGGWTIYLDEVRYMTETLKLKGAVELLLLQGRSLDVTVVAGTQRPRHIPLTFYDQATHLFLWKDSDTENLHRLSSLGGINTRALMQNLPHLGLHDVIHVNTRTGHVVQTRVDP